MILTPGDKFKLIKSYAGHNIGLIVEFKKIDMNAYIFEGGLGKLYHLWFSWDDIGEYLQPIVQLECVKSNDAQQFLLRAAELQQERGKQYDGADNKERSMGKTIVAFNAITGQSLSESEGWLLLQLLKDVRQWAKKDYHADSAEDCIAYAALKAEALANGK